jgi:hypothetical protein
MRFKEEAKTSIHPVEIGYYGKPLSQLTKDELLDAILELSRMYLEAQRKLDNYNKADLRQKEIIKLCG